MTFRTPTGQTGKDAYVYEIAAIQNEQRELHARARRLYTSMMEEIPTDATAEHTFGSRAKEVDYATIQRFLEFCIQLGADTVAYETVEEIARTLR